MAKSKLLTDTQYAALKAKESEYRVSDISGLYLKVGVTGKKSWQLRFKSTVGKLPSNLSQRSTLVGY